MGDTFDTSVQNHRQFENAIGDRILWYRTDKNQKGIYFATEVVAEPKKDDAYNNGYSMSIRVIKTLNEEYKVIPEENGFSDLMNRIKDRKQAGATTNIFKSENPEKLWDIVIGNEKIILKSLDIKIDEEKLNMIKKLKKQNIDDGKMFNPFLDMKLIDKETKHMNFLTNIINPNGTHLQGVLFLKNFIKSIGEYPSQKDNKELIDFDTSEVIVIGEKLANDKDRIDLWIENENYIIAVEAKTKSKDHDGQLVKYDNYLEKYCEEKNKKYLLIYLTMHGDKPQYEAPNNLLLIDFGHGILDFINYSLKESSPTKIISTLTEYKNSLIAYLNNFNDTWNYDLEIIYELTKDKASYETYENIKNNYFYDTKKYQYTEVEDVSKNFEKAKAKIERDFVVSLYNQLSEELEKSGFIFNEEFSNCLLEINEDINVDINRDILYIYKARQLRTVADKNNLSDDQIMNIRDITKTSMVFINENIDENKLLALIVNIDKYGLSVHFHLYIDNEFVKEYDSKIILEANLFHSSMISKFLDEDYLSKKINECKTKIIYELNGINK